MVEIRSTAEQTAEKIKDILLSGRFTVGQKLPAELALVDELQVSRPTVREALRILQADGYIEQIPNRGCFAQIVDITSEKQVKYEQAMRWIGNNGTSLNEFFEARLLIEPYAARMAAQKRDNSVLHAMRWALGDFYKAMATGDNRILADRDKAIHSIIIDAAENRHMSAFFAELAGFFMQYSSYSFNANIDIERTYREHQAICDAIIDGDADLAEESMRAHIVNAFDQIERT